VTQSATLTVNPPLLNSVSVTPSTVLGGASATGAVALSGPAPTGGLIVKLSSSLGSATVPASVTVLAGKSTAQFSIKTTPVGASSTALITASLNGITQQTGLTINPPSLVTLTLSPATVKGGSNSTGTLTISGAAPTGGMAVSLSSNLAAATVPSSVTIPAGKTSITFSVKTTKVTTKSSATISAISGGITKSATLTIT